MSFTLVLQFLVNTQDVVTRKARALTTIDTRSAFRLEVVDQYGVFNDRFLISSIGFSPIILQLYIFSYIKGKSTVFFYFFV